MPSYKFPKDFLWGTATAAHQIEGNNKLSDWWHWEQNKSFYQKYPLEPSGIACDSYNRYKEDFDLCKKLNNNAVRISIEWARLEPKEGHFSQKEFDHYRNVLKSARNRGLKTFVTLHHFTNPLWLSKRGGWTNAKAPYYFARYSKRCAKELGSLIDFFATINEPDVYVMQSYVVGLWPPNKLNPIFALLAHINMILAHRRAYSAIKSVDGNYQVGIVKNVQHFETFSTSFSLSNFLVHILRFFSSGIFLKPLGRKNDFIGLNYYFTGRIKNLKHSNPNDWVSDLGWWLYPKGIEKVLLALKKYNVPIYITENGLADAKDKNREKFLKEILIHCSRAIEKGTPLKGYFHWSLIDNYEWHQGFWPRFGLVEIDRKADLKRKPRDSFYYFAKISKENKVEG